MVVTIEHIITRTLTADLIVVDAGSEPPSATAVKIASDVAVNKDWYLDNVVFR